MVHTCIISCMCNSCTIVQFFLGLGMGSVHPIMQTVLTCYQWPRILYDTLYLKGSCSQSEKKCWAGHALLHVSYGYRQLREMIWILQTKAWVSISFFQLKLHDGFIDVSCYCILASRSRSWVMNPWRNGIFQVVTNANCQGSTLSNFFLVESQLGRRWFCG